MGRALIGDSLGFHLLIVIFGVGLPLLISLLELYGIATKRPRARALARTWAKALVILFIVGAVSGTIISLQLDLLWPKFMDFIGETAGLAFVLEGTFFMIEAVFLSVYMLSWDRFKPIWHWLCSVPIVIGSIGSAIFITSANAFMNNPQGFKLDAQGNPVDVNVAQALFTEATFTESFHSITAYICSTALVLLTIYVWLYMKKRHAADRSWMRKVMGGLAAVAVVFGILVAIAGDLSGQYLAREEPHKLAVAEALMETQTNAPLIMGGIIDGNEVKYGIEVPSLLSFLATHRFDAEVQGLDKIPPEDRPPLIIHYFFDGMVVIGAAIVVIPAAYLALRKWRPAWAHRKVVLIGLLACGPLALLATELGWMLTEIGRQPYAIYGVMRTSDAFTTSDAVMRLGILFPVCYVLLLTIAIIILRKFMHHEGMTKS